jgi:hypothetical protein
LSALCEDVPKHAFIGKYSVSNSALATVAVAKTRKHTAINSIKAHALNLLTMPPPLLRKAVIIAKKPATTLGQILILLLGIKAIFAVQLLFHH